MKTLQTYEGAAFRRANNDVAELLLGGEAALGGDGELECLIRQSRLRADAADGGLHVLLLQRVDDVGGCEPEVLQALRIEPDAHAVVGGSEQAHIAHAAHALQLVQQVDGDVVRQEELVVLRRFGGEGDELQDGG